ncbi:hypothetical protein CMK14_12980 [Candidatus Poribacteria bacterium]|nr:hypothetical protein [Candidatus Poribacteria bacterium]
MVCGQFHSGTAYANDVKDNWGEGHVQDDKAENIQVCQRSTPRNLFGYDCKVQKPVGGGIDA